MEDKLNFDSILDNDTISLEDLIDYEEDNTNIEDQDTEGETDAQDNDKKEELNTTEDIDTDNVEDGETSDDDDTENDPGSLGSNEDNQEGEGSTDSPKFYSSIANALVTDGILPELEDTKVESAEDFANYIEKSVQAKLDDRQKRIDEALNLNIEPSEIKQYENTINILNNITDSTIIDETDNGEKTRRDLITLDLANRGYSEERIQRELKKSFDSGSDIEDAKDALETTKRFYADKYRSLLDNAKKEKLAFDKKLEEDAKLLKESILNDNIFEGLNLNKQQREKSLEAVTRPVFTDSNGNKLTAVQKYKEENPLEFIKKLGVLYTLTDGFKDIENLVKDKVKKEKRKGIKELETVINNTKRNTDGSISLVSNTKDDNSNIT